MKDESFGVVPVFEGPNGYEVLLINQISKSGGEHTFWVFPKGHAEGDETAPETANRELEEETGITNITLESERLFSMAYSFMHEGEKVFKTVTYFLGYCADQKTALNCPEEVSELRWCSFEDARALLTHQNTKRVLEDVITFITTKQ